jgi:5-methylcytosine-specific restriction endonuclease McrA
MFGGDWLIPAEVIADRAVASVGSSRRCTAGAGVCAVAGHRLRHRHTIPRGEGGPTQASNLKCLCRTNHLAKTFWGWRDEQLRDGTIIWTAPGPARLAA